jgi:peptidyl-prolyl cis-trans isomerase C
MKILSLAATAVFSAVLLVPSAARADADPVVARVGSEEIKKSDVMREMSALPPQLQQIPVERLYPQLLERMIDQKLIVAEAYKAKLNESPDFKDKLKHAEERILTDMMLREKVKPRLTDAKLHERYDTIVSHTKKEEEVKASHILMKTEDEAKAIIDQLNKGGDFAKIAKEKSTDKASAEQGGSLGYFTKSTMVPAFADAAFAMKVGETSKVPVKSDFGYHVIKVEDRRMAPPIPFDRVKPQLEAQVAEDLAGDYVETLKKGIKIERFDLDGKPLPEAKPDAKPAAPAAKPDDKKPEQKK